MESVCVYEPTTVIHELTQGIEMAKQLRHNLNSAEAREFLIQKILSSYDKALFVLKSGGQPGVTPLPESSLPKSSASTDSPQSGEFEFGFDQNVFSKKRKFPTPWEDEVRILTENELEGNTNDDYSWRKYGQKDILGAKFPRSYYKCSNNKVQKCMATKQVKKMDENPTAFEVTYKGIHTCNNVSQLAPPPPSPEKHETKPTHHHLYHELSSPNPSDILSNLRANLSVNTWDMDAILPSSFSFPSTPFGFSDDDFQSLFPNHMDGEFLQGYSQPFISPATSESNYLTDWGSSSSLDFPTNPVDLYPDFEFNNSFL
ncbi:hypothetical protein L2E82_06484 [Cichorium intybus]|uniref:Uncharacterized protein n=1 Tax=Cichorium intybus TaxID=13427 RepID=A0ACB9HB82_CICIN|nr:hypothetical protein L2E82_06484 [Cichorium intybus]